MYDVVARRGVSAAHVLCKAALTPRLTSPFNLFTPKIYMRMQKETWICINCIELFNARIIQEYVCSQASARFGCHRPRSARKQTSECTKASHTQQMYVNCHKTAHKYVSYDSLQIQWPIAASVVSDTPVCKPPNLQRYPNSELFTEANMRLFCDWIWFRESPFVNDGDKVTGDGYICYTTRYPSSILYWMHLI